MIGKAFATLAATLIVAVSSHAAEAPQDKSIPIAKVKHTGAVDFEKEILPLLKNNCLACHSQTKPKGGLVLETPQTILKGGENGPAVVPKKPRESLLMKAAAHQDPELIMPPPENKAAAKPLTPEELGLVQLWIEQGAKGEIRVNTPILWQPMPAGLSAIYAVALTGDGQFAACGRANQIFVYHVPTRQLVARLNDPQLQKSSSAGAAHRDTVNSLAYSPDGEVLASGGYREVKLWRRSKPAESFKLPDGIERATTSNDGKWIAIALTNGAIRLLESRGKAAGEFSSGARVTSLMFTPAPDSLVVARGKTLEWFSIPEGKLRAKAEAPVEITSLAILGDGQVASASGDNVIRLFTMTNASDGATATVREIKSPEPATFLAASVTLSNQVLVGSTNGAVQLLEVGNGKVVSESQCGAPLTSLAVRPDGKFFATTVGGAAKLWKTGGTNASTELKGDARAAFLVDERGRDVTFSKSEIEFRKGALKVAESNQTAAVARQKKAGETNAALEKIASAKQTALTNALTARQEAEHAVEALDPEVKKLAEAIAAAEKDFTNATALAKAAKESNDKGKAEKLAADSESKSNAFASAKAAFEQLPAETKTKHKQANEKLVAANKSVADAEKDAKKAEQTRSAAEHELQLAEAAVKKVEGTVSSAKDAHSESEAYAQRAEETLTKAKERLAVLTNIAETVAFSPDGATIFTSGPKGVVQTWNAETGSPFETIPGKRGFIGNIVPLSSRRFISVSASNSAAWAINPGWTLERTIGSGDGSSSLAGRVNALRFTPNGQQLITGGGEPTRGGEIKLWRVSDGKLVRDFPNVHSDSVFALDVSADGKFLASGAADRFAKTIDLENGKILKAFEGHTHHVLGVALKHDGRTLLTAGADNLAKVWDTATGERRKNIEGFNKEITAGAFVGVSDEAVLVAGDGQVTLVKDKGDKVRSFMGATDYVNAAAVSPDGAVIVAGGADGVLRMWNGKDGKVLAEFPPR